jgi:hypothetical protein
MRSLAAAGRLLERTRRRAQHLRDRRAKRHRQPQVSLCPASRQNEQCLRLLPRQPGHVRPVTRQQRDAPAAPAFGVDGNAGRAQRFGIAVDGPGGHLKPAGEFGRGHLAAALQEQHHLKQSAGSHDC